MQILTREPKMPHRPSPQADGDLGDPRPTAACSTEIRDIRLRVIAREIAPLLFAALKAHAYGVADDTLWEDLTTEQREQFHEQSRQVVYQQDPNRKQYAIRQARIAAYRWLESFAVVEIGAAEDEASVIGKFVRLMFPRFTRDLLAESAGVIPDLINTYQTELVPDDPIANLAKRQRLLQRGVR